MSTITRILCPVDFSGPSTHAFQYADDFAAWVGAELVLTHAFDDPVTYDGKGQWTPSNPGIAKELEAITSKHNDVSVTRVLHAGPAGQVICWAAEHRGCDLIIMGTHGRTGLNHLLFGSTAEYVLKQARCPVLTIRLLDKETTPLREPMVNPLPAPPFM